MVEAGGLGEGEGEGAVEESGELIIGGTEEGAKGGKDGGVGGGLIVAHGFLDGFGEVRAEGSVEEAGGQGVLQLLSIAAEFGRKPLIEPGFRGRSRRHPGVHGAWTWSSGAEVGTWAQDEGFGILLTEGEGLGVDPGAAAFPAFDIGRGKEVLAELPQGLGRQGSGGEGTFQLTEGHDQPLNRTFDLGTQEVGVIELLGQEQSLEQRTELTLGGGEHGSQGFGNASGRGVLGEKGPQTAGQVPS